MSSETHQDQKKTHTQITSTRNEKSDISTYSPNGIIIRNIFGLVPSSWYRPPKTLVISLVIGVLGVCFVLIFDL